MRRRQHIDQEHALAAARALLREHLRSAWQRLRRRLRPMRSQVWSPVQFAGWPQNPEFWASSAFGLLILILLLEQHLAGGLR